MWSSKCSNTSTAPDSPAAPATPEPSSETATTSCDSPNEERTISKLFYYAHLTIKAEWPNGVFWTPTSRGPIVVPDPTGAADLVAGHVEHSLGLIAQTNAKTDPTSYTASGHAEAYYGDGRQAALPLAEVRTQAPDDLVRHVRSWAQEQFQKLAGIESADL